MATDATEAGEGSSALPQQLEFELVGPRAASMIESMRAVGYTPQTAVADLVDNSLSAGARNVWLDLHWNGADSYLRILDDGIGMSESELSAAMRLGSQSPLKLRDSSDLGRFGLGLKTASFSQARRLTVASKRLGDTPSVRRWDLDYVGKTDEWRLLKQPALGSSSRLSELDSMQSGTLVLWEAMDRIVEHASIDDRSAHQRFLELARSIDSHLGMVFHRFIGPRPVLHIWINDEAIEAWDPFLTDETATQKLAEEVLIFDEKRIVIRPFVLPHHSKIGVEVQRAGAGQGGWSAHQGFYVYRNRRLLVPGDWLRLGFQKEEYCRLARIQVDLPSSLDHAWSIDVKKSSARPPGALRSDLKRIATITRQRASEVYRHRGKVVARSASRDDSFVWNRTVKHGKIAYRVNREYPMVKALLADLDGEAAQVEEVLRLIEETIPSPLIVVDASEQPESQGDPFGEGAAELLGLGKRLLTVLKGQGLNPAQVRDRMLSIEPFSYFPQLVESILGEAM